METTVQNEIQKTGLQPKLSELYSDIELTEEEKAEAIEKALFEARYAKAAAIHAKQYLEKLTAPEKVVRYTSAELWEHLNELDGFDIDADNEYVVDLLCKYFADDPSFEEHKDANMAPYSLKKGLLLFGGFGVGKTMLLEIFRNNQKQSFQVVACQDVEASYAKNGPDIHPQTRAMGLRRYFGLVSLQTKNQYGHNTLGFLFDDLGQENKSTKFFGTERNVMLEVISQRYKNRLFQTTHITTNLSADQIRTIYTDRVADRMREMFNLISYPENARSRRK